MGRSTAGCWVVFASGVSALAAGCSSADEGFEGIAALETAPLGTRAQALTVEERLAACRQDPRVLAGLVSADICAGAGVFFEETFDGNGRTCGSCHPAENNTTLDVDFIAELQRENPDDPLFSPDLPELETGDLTAKATILENVDGFGVDPTTRFVSRAVSHVLSLSTTLRPDFAPGTANPPAEATGWGGDGSPDGTLRGFLRGAVEQHFTKSLARVPGTDFRLPTAEEERVAELFQKSLGRQNELDLQRVSLRDPDADEGRRAFLDPLRGRCNVCHQNAGANFIDTGRNRNFDTGTRDGGQTLTLGSFDGELLFDGGFGGKDLPQPNFDTLRDGGRLDAFGDGTFNPPPLIEAADTAPLFHNNLHIIDRFPQDIDDAIVFYGRLAFLSSPAAQSLDARFGEPLDVQPDSGVIARFLRALNAAFNIDIALQRLDATRVLVQRFPRTRVDIQQKLLELARAEVDDASFVLENTPATIPLYPVAVDQLRLAREQIDVGITTPSSTERRTRIDNALTRTRAARAEFGTNITFRLGEGNLMF